MSLNRSRRIPKPLSNPYGQPAGYDALVQIGGASQQSIPNNSSTKIEGRVASSLFTQPYDPASQWSEANEEFTPAVTGLYRISIRAYYNDDTSWSNTEEHYISLYQSTTLIASFAHRTDDAGTEDRPVRGHLYAELTAGTAYHLEAFQNSGSSQDLRGDIRYEFIDTSPQNHFCLYEHTDSETIDATFSFLEFFTEIAYTTKVYDTVGMYDSNLARFTFSKAGLYRLDIKAGVEATTLLSPGESLDLVFAGSTVAFSPQETSNSHIVEFDYTQYILINNVTLGSATTSSLADTVALFPRTDLGADLTSLTSGVGDRKMTLAVELIKEF